MYYNYVVKYKEYIKSKEWKEKSAIFIKSIGHCEDCGRIKNLGCHHKTYKNLGNETKKDILVWCWACHKYYHKNYTSKYTKKGKIFVGGFDKIPVPSNPNNRMRKCDLKPGFLNFPKRKLSKQEKKELKKQSKIKKKK